MKWPKQGAEGSLVMGYATRLAGETEVPHAQRPWLWSQFLPL